MGAKSDFNARARNGETYRVLFGAATPQGVNPATIAQGQQTTGKLYFDVTGAVFVIGQNPGTNHPRMLTALQSAKRNGAKIVTINPFREAGLLRFKHPQEASGVLGSGTDLTDLYLQFHAPD